MFKTCRLDQEKSQPAIHANSKPRTRVIPSDASEMGSLDLQAGDLVRELARERQLRLEAECTARELRIECDRFKAKIQESQQSFDRIHTALEKMRHYRQQIDILQQEKDLQQQRYEGNLSRLREQIGMLESQKTTLQMQLEEQRFRPPVDGDRERSQLLLRIARLERGNSQLMNDLTTQRQQFDSCLDKFATQVSQSLMEQKGLKRENSELHRRNAELQRMINCLEGQLVCLSKDSGVGSINGIENEELDIHQRPPPLLPRHLPMSEKFHRRSLLTPTRTPPSMVVKLRGSATSDDVQGVLAKMISPTDMPSPASGNALSMRRARSDNTPCQINADGYDEGMPFSQPVHRTASYESLSSECSDVPVINYWEMYQERQQRIAIPGSLRPQNSELVNENKPRPESPTVLHLPSESPDRSQSTTDLSDPVTRATMLDALLGHGLQSDDEDASASTSRYHLDIGDAHGDTVSSDSRDDIEYLRCVRRRNMETLPQHSSVIEFSQHLGFLRYGEEEREAMKHFEFLNDFSDSERTVTDSESSDSEEQGPSHESASWYSVEKADVSSTSTSVTDHEPSPKRTLSSERIAQLLNGSLGTSCVRSASKSQPSTSEVVTGEKKVTKMSARVEHASSLTAVIDNVHCGTARPLISRTHSSCSPFSRRSTSKSPSPQRSYDELYYGVTIRDNQAAQRLSLAALGKKSPEITPVNTPETPRQSGSRSTLI